MATAKELNPMIGTMVLVRMEKLLVRCRVVDATSEYGHDRILITPAEGSGEQWVDADKRVAGKGKS